MDPEVSVGLVLFLDTVLTATLLQTLSLTPKLPAGLAHWLDGLVRFLVGRRYSNGVLEVSGGVLLVVGSEESLARRLSLALLLLDLLVDLLDGLVVLLGTDALTLLVRSPFNYFRRHHLLTLPRSL